MYNLKIASSPSHTHTTHGLDRSFRVQSQSSYSPVSDLGYRAGPEVRTDDANDVMSQLEDYDSPNSR